MKALAATILTLATTSLFAQTPSFDGKWEMQVVGDNGPDVIILQLQVESDAMTGTMTRSNPAGQPAVQIRDLWIAIDEIRFTVTSPDGLRSVRFSGKISGDKIQFSREIVKGAGGGSGIYGIQGPHNVEAQRKRETTPPSR